MTVRWAYSKSRTLSATPSQRDLQHEVQAESLERDERLRHLSTEFYDELVAHAVPIDLRALKALKGSPLALDIYSWLTYRMSYLRKPCLIPWEALQTQFGADYGRVRDFRRKFLGHLADVLQVYPAARLTEQPAGLLLRPSLTHLPRAKAGRH